MTTIALNDQEGIALIRVPREVRELDYTTTDNNVEQDVFDVRDRDTAVISTRVSTTNAADLTVEVAIKEFTDVASLGMADFRAHTIKAAINNNSSHQASSVTVLPRLEGVTAVRYILKSSIASNAADTISDYRGYA